MNTPTQGQLLAAAIAVVEADPGIYQEDLEAQLREQFPGLPSLNYYANPAAEAMMRRMCREEQRRVGVAADRARLRRAGKPESWADRER